MKSMVAENNLAILLRTMKPKLNESEYIFCNFNTETAAQLTNDALGFFREAEGVTLILRKKFARARRLPCDSSWALITLTVHSSLTAIGFLAALSTAFASKGISLNVVSGCYHDHLFVPWSDRHRSLSILKELSKTKS